MALPPTLPPPQPSGPPPAPSPQNSIHFIYKNRHWKIEFWNVAADQSRTPLPVDASKLAPAYVQQVQDAARRALDSVLETVLKDKKDDPLQIEQFISKLESIDPTKGLVPKGGQPPLLLNQLDQKVQDAFTQFIQIACPEGNAPSPVLSVDEGPGAAPVGDARPSFPTTSATLSVEATGDPLSYFAPYIEPDIVTAEDILTRAGGAFIDGASIIVPGADGQLVLPRVNYEKIHPLYRRRILSLLRGCFDSSYPVTGIDPGKGIFGAVLTLVTGGKRDDTEAERTRLCALLEQELAKTADEPSSSDEAYYFYYANPSDRETIANAVKMIKASFVSPDPDWIRFLENNFRPILLRTAKELIPDDLKNITPENVQAYFAKPESSPLQAASRALLLRAMLNAHACFLWQRRKRSA